MVFLCMAGTDIIGDNRLKIIPGRRKTEKKFRLGHMAYLLKKIRFSLYFIQKIKLFLDRKTLLLLYQTLAKSHILYCITSWCFGNETMINKLQCAVNKLMRSIFNVGKRQTVSYVMKDNNLLTIHQIRDLEIATFEYNFTNKLLPLPFDHSFKTEFKIIKNTRSQSSLYLSFSRVHITKQAMRYKGLLIWNDISFNLRQDSKSLKSFRSAVTKFFLTKPLQS